MIVIFKEIVQSEIIYKINLQVLLKARRITQWFALQAVKCRNMNWKILPDGRDMIERWEQYYEKHLNGTDGVFMGFQNRVGNDNVCAADNGNQPAPDIREVNNVI